MKINLQSNMSERPPEKKFYRHIVQNGKIVEVECSFAQALSAALCQQAAIAIVDRKRSEANGRTQK